MRNSKLLSLQDIQVKYFFVLRHSLLLGSYYGCRIALVYELVYTLMKRKAMSKQARSISIKYKKHTTGRLTFWIRIENKGLFFINTAGMVLGALSQTECKTTFT